MKYARIVLLVILFLATSIYVYAAQPTANAGVNRNVALGEETKLSGSGTDSDGDIITFKWTLVDLPGGSLSELSADNIPNPIFVPDSEGNYKFSLKTNDGNSFSAPSNVIITANEADPSNTKPVPYAGVEREVNVGEEITLTGSGFDGDGDILQYLWILLSQPGSNDALLSNPNVQDPTFTPDVAGEYVFSLIVNDGMEDSDVEGVTITASISGANRAPAADPGPIRTIKLNEQATLAGAGSDPDNDALTYTWSVSSKPLGTQNDLLSDNNIPNPTFTPDVAGEYIFSLTVDDGQLDSEPNTVTYTVQELLENNKPVADAGVDRNVNVGEKTELQGTGLDSDGDVISYRWSIINIPSGSGISLSSPNSQNPTFIVDVVGDYIFNLIVNDGKEDSSGDSVTITASTLGVNRVPSADPGPARIVKLGRETTLSGTGSDPDNDALTYTWSIVSGPIGNQITLSDVNIVNPIFIPDVDGEYVFSLIVNDGQTDSIANTVVYTAEIFSGNNKPVADAGSDLEVDEEQEVELSGSGRDSDGDVISYRWIILNMPVGSGAFLSNPNSQNPTFVPAFSGSYTFQLVVNDGKESDLDNVNVNVVELLEVCVENSCDLDTKQWCSNGAMTADGYCDRCGSDDSSCPTCEEGVCDIEGKNKCVDEIWSTVDYCSTCGNLDASCDVSCTNNACDTSSRQWCDNGEWEDSGYCLHCSNSDSSCYFECTDNACDTNSKQWCNDGVWTGEDYCNQDNCGARDESCGLACESNLNEPICDATSNRWCNAVWWATLQYCSQCSDSECSQTCTNDACDVDSKQRCDNGIWTDVDYCGTCGQVDSSCSVTCEDNTCDTTSNKRCSGGVWVSVSYCDHCGLKDSDCTIVCSEGECDTTNEKVCSGGNWTSTSYDTLCVVEVDITEVNEIDVNVSVKTCRDHGNCSLRSSCSLNSSCASGLCSGNRCVELTSACDDNIKNDRETDVDCGGGECDVCEVGKRCGVNSDCGSNICDSGSCKEDSTCDDGILNGDETGVDCGGSCSECRLSQTCSADVDCGPGLVCDREVCLEEETDIVESKDKDKDGILDEWELLNGLNPNNALDNDLDFDEDGIINIQEFNYGTNPNKEDSDGDGVSDKEELDKGTDPLDFESKPGGAFGKFVLVILLFGIFGGGSYGAYYYFTKRESKASGVLSGIKLNKSLVLPPKFNFVPKLPTRFSRRSPFDEAMTQRRQAIVDQRRDKKREKRGKILDVFGKKKVSNEGNKLLSLSKEKNKLEKINPGKEDIFSKLKLISKKKK